MVRKTAICQSAGKWGKRQKEWLGGDWTKKGAVAGDLPTITVMQLIDLAAEFSFADNFIVGFIPPRERCQLGPGKGGEWAKVETPHNQPAKVQEQGNGDTGKQHGSRPKGWRNVGERSQKHAQ